jgi:hypothetical protein
VSGLDDRSLIAGFFNIVLRHDGTFGPASWPGTRLRKHRRDRRVVLYKRFHRFIRTIRRHSPGHARSLHNPFRGAILRRPKVGPRLGGRLDRWVVSESLTYVT